MSMSMANSLCNLPPPPLEGCCDAPPPPPAAPVIPYNPPGLAAIQYRIGTFTSFRQAMLDEVARANLLRDITSDALPDSPPAIPPNPFALWHAGTSGDYQTMFVELWAYLADILTFYQERIANEAYLPTATQRDSLLRLAGLIDYRPAPGSGANALLAFTVEKGKSITVPASFRTGSKPAPGKPQAVFETEAALTGLGDYSAIPLSEVAPTNQFAQISALRSIFSGLVLDNATLASAASALYGNAGAAYLKTITFNKIAPVTEAFGAELTASSAFTTSRSLNLEIPILVPRFDFIFNPFRGSTTRQIVLKGTNTRLAPGDYVLVVENQGSSSEQTTLRKLMAVTPDKPSSTTTITWSETPGTSYDNATLYALRVSAAPFASNAPNWNSLPPTLNNSDHKHDTTAPYQQNWDSSSNRWAYIPAPAGISPDTTQGDPDKTLFLDGIYDTVNGTTDTQNPSWAVVIADGQPSTVFHILDARAVSKTAYTLTARVTRLTLDASVPGYNSNNGVYPLRTTSILAGSELLELQNNLPLPDPLSGKTLVLAGLYPKLQANQTVILQGYLYDPSTIPPSQILNAEAGILDGAPVLDAANAITTVTLKEPLDKQYARAGAVLMANVVEATQGETVRDEILGSSDGSAFQSYPLKKNPLTYLPSQDSEGLAAVQSTLTVTVNGVRWDEEPTLLESAANDQVYTIAQDTGGQTTVTFGDGYNGARPPTGRDNIHARYRKGLGTSGNLDAGGIQQLIDSVPGLQKVSNPQPSLGGADAESIDQIRVNAPASIRTFGRAVSTEDYAALALSYPGIVKASAAWIQRAADLKPVVQPYIQLTVATENRTPLAEQPQVARNLRAFLDKRRDPNVPLRMIDFTPVYIDVAATIDLLDQYPRQATLNAVLAALNPGLNPDGTPGYFAFEHMQFGESVHLSAVYAAIQAVAVVRDATITTMRRLDLDSDPATVRDSIFIRPTEIVVIANDPADTANQRGKLVITLGEGGFIDT